MSLRLQKDAESGEIQPLILEYEMPTTENGITLEKMPIACVPIQLTRIAATDNMPIQVYILGDARAVPLNFIELELDDTQVNWLGCQTNPRCFDTDYRSRFDRAASEIVNHTFVTEYAGPAGVMEGQIVIPLTKEQIAGVEDEQEFFDRYSFLLPNVPLVDSILSEYLPEGGRDKDWVFNATQLAEDLHEKVLQPAIDDQVYVDGFQYLTRLYARLGPETMTKDPFFALKPELPMVDNIHRATALPVCTEDVPSALQITVANGNGTVTIPARISDCAGWVPMDNVVLVNDTRSPATQIASYGFAGEAGVIVLRSADGTFDMKQVEEAIMYGDSLVINQAISEYVNASDVPSNPDSNETEVPNVSSNGTDVPITTMANETNITMVPASDTVENEFITNATEAPTPTSVTSDPQPTTAPMDVSVVTLAPVEEVSSAYSGPVQLIFPIMVTLHSTVEWLGFSSC